MTWTEVKEYAAEEYINGRLIGKEYAMFILGAVQEQMKIDADSAIKKIQAELLMQQKLTEVQGTAKAAYEVLTLLPAQKLAIDADAEVKTSQKAMIDQQKLTEVQGTAKAAYEVQNFLPVDLGIKQQQVKQLKVEVALKHTQKNQIEQSVYDNRLIKIEGDLADMTGMILNGGTQAVPAGLATSLTNAISILVGIPKETVAIEA